MNGVSARSMTLQPRGQVCMHAEGKLFPRQVKGRAGQGGQGRAGLHGKCLNRPGT